MNTDIEYERPPEEDDEREYRKPKKVKRKAFAIVRVPWCKTPLKVYDDDDPDEVIEEFVAKGRCKWLNENDPELADKIREAYFLRQNGLDRKPQKRRFKK